MVDAVDIARLQGLEAHLRETIRGQDHALPRIGAAFCRGALNLASNERPRCSLLFAGPTGTGKSETFAQAVNYVLGPGRLITFDLSEYHDRSAVNKLIGEDRDDPGLLGRALAGVEEAGLLFDEIEKAHPLMFDLFLQILWRGQITLATGRVVRFERHFVGFTSNLGGAEAMRMTRSNLASIEQTVLRRVLTTLRPEFVSRLDEKLVFARLEQETQREICKLEVGKEVTRLRKLGYDLAVSREAMEFLLREGFDATLGARPLRQTVAREIQNAVVRRLFSSGTCAGIVACESATRSLVIR